MTSRKTPGSGRKKGTPNKRHPAAKELADKLGIDPFHVLLLFVSGDWQALGYERRTVTHYSASGDSYEIDVIEPSLRLSAAKEATQYLYAKRRQEDSEGKPEDQAPIFIASSDDLKKLVEAARGTK